MLDLAIVDKLNRAGFVVAPYNTPEEVPSVKSVSGPARHVGEADKRVLDSRGGSPCGENRCGIGECREGEGTSAVRVLSKVRERESEHTMLDCASPRAYQLQCAGVFPGQRGIKPRVCDKLSQK